MLNAPTGHLTETADDRRTAQSLILKLVAGLTIAGAALVLLGSHFIGHP